MQKHGFILSLVKEENTSTVISVLLTTVSCSFYLISFCFLSQLTTGSYFDSATSILIMGNLLNSVCSLKSIQVQERQIPEVSE